MLLGAGVVILAAIVGLVTMVRSEDTAQAKPPPVDARTTHVACAPDTVRTGDLLTFTVSNPASTPFEYGLGMTVERWDGKAWHPAYQAEAAISATSRAKNGRLAPPGEALMVPAMALEAPADGTGPQHQVRLTEVPAGWYRLIVSRVGAAPAGDPPSATGVFQVRS